MFAVEIRRGPRGDPRFCFLRPEPGRFFRSKKRSPRRLRIFSLSLGFRSLGQP